MLRVCPKRGLGEWQSDPIVEFVHAVVHDVMPAKSAVEDNLVIWAGVLGPKGVVAPAHQYIAVGELLEVPLGFRYVCVTIDEGRVEIKVDGGGFRSVIHPDDLAGGMWLRLVEAIGAIVEDGNESLILIV